MPNLRFRFAHLHDQIARSRALVAVSRRRRFLAPLYTPGFTHTLERELQLPGHLRPFASETHRRFALLSVRSVACVACVAASYYDLG